MFPYLRVVIDIISTDLISVEYHCQVYPLQIMIEDGCYQLVISELLSNYYAFEFFV